MKNRKKAFTLMELLVVIILIGIVLAIVLPSVSSLISNRSKKEYEIHIKTVEVAAKTYIDENYGELSDKNAKCFDVDYQTLLSDDLVKEDSIHCSGSIIVTSTNNKLTPSYYLTCVDNDGKSMNDSSDIPEGCRGFNGNYKIGYEIYTDSKPYDGNYWVKDAIVHFNSDNTYGYKTVKYEYSTKLNGVWKEIKTGSNISEKSDIKDLSGTFYVRGVDEVGNVSSSVSIPVKMDNTGPRYVTGVSGGWLSKKITISNATDLQVGKLAEKAYSFDGGKSWTTKTDEDFIENKKENVCVKDILGNMSCKDITISGIDRVVPNPPTITTSDNKPSGGWHSSDFTITLSGANNLSGNTYYWGMTNNPTNVGTSIRVSTATNEEKTYYFKVCAGNGYCSTVNSYVVKIDKTVPNPPTITASDNKASNTWHNSDFRLNFSGSSAPSGITYYYGTTSYPTTPGGSVSINTPTTGTTYYVKACSGAGLCSSNSSYIVKLDKKKPVITAKNTNNYITTSTGADIKSYFNIETNISGNQTVCRVGEVQVTNTNQLSLGVNTVTCTTTSTSGLSTSVSTTFRHRYTAIASCNSGGTLQNNNSCYYQSNGGVCGTRWDSCATCDGGYTSCSKGNIKDGQCEEKYISDYKCTVGSRNGKNCHQDYGSDETGCSNDAMQNGLSCNCCEFDATGMNCTGYCIDSTAKPIYDFRKFPFDSNWNDCITCHGGNVANSCNKATGRISYSCPTAGRNSANGATIYASKIDTEVCGEQTCTKIPTCSF